MTAILQCDYCGRVASSADPTNSDPTRDWWELTHGPAPGGSLLGLEVGFDEEDTSEDTELQPEPDRHFCSIACLRQWAAARPDEP